MKIRVFENSLIKDKVTVLKTSEETNGEYLLVEVELKVGGGNIMHYHTSFMEEFTAVEGVLGVDLGKEKLRLHPGQQAIAGLNDVHRFYNPGDSTIRFHVKIAPARERFLHCLCIGYGLANDGKVNKKGIPKSFDHLAILMDLSDTRFPGFLSLISPILLRRAKRARRKGVDKELMERYWGDADGNYSYQAM